VITVLGDGLLWEEGPNSFQPTETILQLCEELGISEEIAFADPGLPRYIATMKKPGFFNSNKEAGFKLIALPHSISQFISTDLFSTFSKWRIVRLPHSISQFISTDLFSTFSKWRIIRGLLGFISLPKRSENAGTGPNMPYAEETIREFFTRHFGNELYERLVDPFISGVYAGDGGR